MEIIRVHSHALDDNKKIERRTETWFLTCAPRDYKWIDTWAHQLDP
jgi:hypothetical protein